MSLRGVILKLVPARMAAAMEADSRAWMLRCRTCGDERSIWDQGGLRYKARGNKRVGAHCPRCGRLRSHDVYRRTPA